MKYKCGVCGYIYDEEKEGVRFADLPDDWSCPVCGEGKEGFSPMEDEEDGPSPAGAPQPSASIPSAAPEVLSWESEELRELTAGQLSAICSNLQRGCGVQQLTREAELFGRIAEYFESRMVAPDSDGVASILAMINADIGGYNDAKMTAIMSEDRGALRVLTWSEKATMIMRTVLERFQRDPDMVNGTGVYVCDICGFMYIGDDPPSVCPVCKVPGHMILRIQGVA